MQSTEDNLYKAPEANLVSNVEGEHPILKFKRFSTWGVFGLVVITMGYYSYYWLISRIKIANTVSEKKTSLIPIYISLALGISSLILTYGPFPTELVLAGMGLSFLSMPFMLYSIFSLRNRLVEITNKGSTNPEKMGGIKTFFFNVMFLSYRINKNIDLQKGIASAIESLPAETKEAA